MTTESILQEAERIINGDRREDYGCPGECFDMISRFWQIYLNKRLDSLKSTHRDFEQWLTAKDVAHMMTLMKMARATTGAKKRDTYVDIAGYAALANDL